LGKKRKSVYSGIGGQAVLEGVMMKNKKKYSVAVRKPDGEVEVQVWDDKSIAGNSFLGKVPFIRGIINFIDSMILGMKTLTYSSSFYEEEEPKNPEKKSLFEKIFKEKAESVITGITVFISIIISVGLFMLLPYFISELCSKFVRSATLKAVIEAAVRLLLFLSYVVLISLMKDIRRLYQYHGAEHKCINCIEAGRPLTVKNVKRCKRQNRRCGTSFLLIVMVISIILFFFIRVDEYWLRIVLRLLLIPVIAGISYEILRFAGRHDNIFVKILSAPGMWLQLLTTKEPDDEMIEVGIAAVEAVFDWEKFENKHFKRRMVKKKKKLDDGSIVETNDETMEISVVELNEKLEELKANKEANAAENGDNSVNNGDE